MSGGTPEVSVVIATIGESRLLDRCIAAIAGGEVRPLELVLVDQGPPLPIDGLRGYLDDHGIRLTHERIPRSTVAAARNAGVAVAAGDYVAFTDDDCIPEPGWLAGLIAGLRHESAAAATGRVLPLDEGQPGLVPVSLRTATTARAFRRGDDYAPWDIGTGGNLLVERGAYEAAGGFDADFGPGGRFRAAEDIELLDRLVRSGAPVAYSPNAVVYHEMKPPSGRLARGVPYGFGMGALIARLPRGLRRRTARRYVGMQARAFAATLRGHDAEGALEGPLTLLGAAAGALVGTTATSRPGPAGGVPESRPERENPAGGGRGNRLLRRLDQTVAVALLAALGAVRRPRERAEPLRRIGIMKSTGIGDMILTTAIVRDVIEGLPDAEVVLFAGGDNVGLARLVPGAEVVELPTAKPWAAVPLIRDQGLDALIDLGQWTRLEALYAALSGSGWTAGFATPGQRRHYAFDVTIPHSGDRPEIDNFRALAAELGVRSTSLPSFKPPEPAPAAPVTEPYVVFHLWPGGYRSELREWPIDSWRQLAGQAVARDVSVVLTGGAEDVDRTAAFIESCGVPPERIESVAGRLGIDELIPVLAGARCVVSVNTGVMHLAAACGAPTIALNGPTSSLRWGPIGPRTICLDSSLPGCGFLNLGFEYDGRRTDCMQGISVERVKAAMMECIDD